MSKSRARSRTRSSPAPASREALGPSLRALQWPLAFVLALFAFVTLPQIRGNPALAISFAGASAVMLAWLVVLWTQARATGRRLTIEVSLRPQHYLQALAHTAIFVYWGIYWHPLRDAAPLIAAQIVFAYAFDMLVAWSRRDRFTLGFGPFPVIYSLNLFLRFRDDWFYLQFVMVAIGFLAKELIRWEKDGRRAHIFNPSSFPLAVFSLGLIATGTTNITWGEEIATLLIMPPQIYLFIFLVALPGQLLFRVTTMTLPAVLTTYLFSVVYFKLTGTYFFFDSNVPIAVFLGMHLLFTDPSTAPRTELGRIFFGICYGLTVVGLYALLQRVGAPTFYDKLLQVPLMNLMVRAFDRAAQSKPLAWMSPERLGAGLLPRTRSLAYVTLWIVVFGAMTAANGVGDYHPGHTVPFWEAACRDGRPRGCSNLVFMETKFCAGGSGWACNEVGILGATVLPNAAPPGEAFDLGCKLGLGAACRNKTVLEAGRRTFEHQEPRLADYLGLLQQGKGPIPDKTPFEIYTRACSQEWVAGCGKLGDSYFHETVPPDRPRAAKLWEEACAGGHAQSCSNIGFMYRMGDGVTQDIPRALGYLKRACDLGMPDACRWLAEAPGRQF